MRLLPPPPEQFNESNIAKDWIHSSRLQGNPFCPLISYVEGSKRRAMDHHDRHWCSCLFSLSKEHRFQYFAGNIARIKPEETQ